MQIAVGRIGTIQFTALDHNGEPASLDGPLSFVLADDGSDEFAALTVLEADNQVDLRGLAAGTATILATGDVRLGEGVEAREWSCAVSIYEPADQLACELIAMRPVIDE